MPPRTVAVPSATVSSAIDAYIARAQPFAQPILVHLRDTVRTVVPDSTEAMKWSRPFFLRNGVILANMAAFQQHCSFGLWGPEMAEILRGAGIDSSEGMGTFGRLTSLADLPPATQLRDFIRRAAELIRDGSRTRSIQRIAKAKPTQPAAIPPALAQALGRHTVAAENFARLSPGCRREYIDWIAGAKREETRSRRVEEALAMIAEGKARHWKYQTTAPQVG